MRLNSLLNKITVILAVCFLLISADTGFCADPPTPTKKQCKNTFPDLMNDVCWECMFPIRVGGKEIMTSEGMSDNIAALTGNADDYNPDGAYTCSCEKSGTTYFGVYVSFWEPARVMEVIPQPGCFSFLFGMDMSESLTAGYGNKGKSATQVLDQSFQQVHYYSAPLFDILELMVQTDFCHDWSFSDFDIAYMTEIDPIWGDDELGALLYAESALFANPISQALCAVDCLPATLNYPLNALFWCAGCWGSLYPMTGTTANVNSPIQTSSLQMARLLGRLARYPVPPAIEYDTSSSTAKCGGTIRPLLKKSQYRFSTLSPIAETRSYHTLGASSLTWGEFRTVPAVGEDHTFLTWRKRNCCMRFLGD